jgi:uncharacterized membrane protein
VRSRRRNDRLLRLAGIFAPLAASLLFIPLRRILPRPAWIAGLLFGLWLLATVGVGDPLSPDNIDFSILSPTWLAVTLVCLTALLFGMTFSAVVALLDATAVVAAVAVVGALTEIV